MRLLLIALLSFFLHFPAPSVGSAIFKSSRLLPAGHAHREHSRLGAKLPIGLIRGGATPLSDEKTKGRCIGIDLGTTYRYLASLVVRYTVHTVKF